MANCVVLDFGRPGIYINYQMFIPVTNTYMPNDKTQQCLVNLRQHESEDDLFDERIEELLKN